MRPKISDQFADLKAELGTVSEDEWASIPDTADYSIRHRKKARPAIHGRTPMAIQMS